MLFELVFVFVSMSEEVFQIIDCWVVLDKVSPSIGDGLESREKNDPFAGKLKEMRSSSCAFDCNFVLDRVGGGLFLGFSDHFIVGENPGGIWASSVENLWPSFG